MDVIELARWRDSCFVFRDSDNKGQRCGWEIRAPAGVSRR